MAPQKPLPLAICGALGRMGSRVAELALSDPRFQVLAGVVRHRGGGANSFPLLPEAALGELPRKTEVLIDFTAPAASLAFAQAAAASRRKIVIGTTGFSEAEQRELRRLSRRTAVFLAPNFSPGMNLLFRVAELAAAALPSYEARITEVHHVHKKDAPSGSAKRLAEAVRAARGPAGVPIESRREGRVVGDHSLAFQGSFERVLISHSAFSRDVFARGALEAALWVRRRGPGLYDMRRMLGL